MEKKMAVHILVQHSWYLHVSVTNLSSLTTMSGLRMPPRKVKKDNA